MEKTYDELKEELVKVQKKISEKNIELNGLRIEAEQIEFKMDEIRNKTYNDFVGKYFLIKKDPGTHSIMMFVESFEMSPDLTYGKLYGFAFIFSRPSDVSFECNFHENFWFNVYSKNDIEEISKDDFDKAVTESFIKIQEIFNK